MTVTKDQVLAIMPRCDAGQWVDPLNAAMECFEINTSTRMAAFLAQLAHESTETTHLTEGLSYSRAERLYAVWPKRFPTPASAEPYLKNPQKLANCVSAPALFERARVAYGTVVWPGEIDIAPETLYDDSVPFNDPAPVSVACATDQQGN